MFYSNDLLTLRGGGKFNLIWLLSTTSDKLSLARKRKADLLSLNYKTIVEELQKLFPVTGKKTSLSLRTSAVLMHGVFISFKLRVDILNNDTIKLLGTTTSKFNSRYLSSDLFNISLLRSQWSRNNRQHHRHNLKEDRPRTRRTSRPHKVRRSQGGCGQLPRAQS